MRRLKRGMMRAGMRRGMRRGMEMIEGRDERFGEKSRRSLSTGATRPMESSAHENRAPPQGRERDRALLSVSRR